MMAKNFLIWAFDSSRCQNRKCAGRLRTRISLETLSKKCSGLCHKKVKLRHHEITGTLQNEPCWA